MKNRKKSFVGLMLVSFSLLSCSENSPSSLTTTASPSITTKETGDTTSTTQAQAVITSMKLFVDREVAAPGDTVTFSVSFSGTNLKESDKKVTFSIVKGQDQVDGDISDDGVIAISQNAVNNSTILVKATSVLDPTKSAEKEVKVTIGAHNATLDFETLNTHLEALAKETNYAVTYTENSKAMRDVYTPNYVYVDWMGGGYVTLNSYDKAQFGSDTVAYEYAYYSDKSIEVLSAQKNSSGAYVKAASEYNYLPWYTDIENNIDESDFAFDDARGLYTENNDVLYLFGRVLGYNTDSFSYDAIFFTGVGFTLSKDDKLSFTLYYKPDEDSNLIQAFASATFDEIGTAKMDVIDNYFKNYAISDTYLTDEQGKKLKDSTVSTTNEILYAGDLDVSWKSLGSSKVDSYKDASDPLNDRNRLFINDTVNQESHEYIYTKVKEGNAAIETYIDGQNKPQETTHNDVNWGYQVLTIQDEVDLSGFRKVGEGKYHYFGGNADKIFSALTHLPVLSDISFGEFRGLDLEISEDGTLSLISQTNAYIEGEESTTHLRIQTKTKVENTPRTFEKPHVFEMDTQAKAIQAIFDKLKGEESYQVTGYMVKKDNSHGDPTFTLTFIKDKALIIDSVDGDTQRRTLVGYKLASEGVIPFTGTFDVSKTKATLKATGTALTNDTLGNHIPFTASGAVFTQSDKVLSAKSGVKDIGPYIFGGYRRNFALESTVKITLDSKDRVLKINYNYLYHNLLTGKEEASVVYGDQTLPSYIDSSEFEALKGHAHNESWQDEKAANSAIYSKMKSTFGEKADEIPYLYDESVADKWGLGFVYDQSGDEFSVYVGTKDDVSSYLDRYEALLKTKGFVSQEINGRTYYVKDGIGIRISKQEGNGAYKGLYFRVVK